MEVKILGSAAGGGFPQWNCACPNCLALRGGKFQGKARSQTQIAVSADGASWFLLGASPDLRAQIESCPELHPQTSPSGNGARSSPIAGVVLASADLDHVLGLLLLRELQPFQVSAAASTLRILRDDNSMFRMLNRVPDQVRWQAIENSDPFALETVSGKNTGIRCRALSLSSRHPAYAQGASQSADAVLGLVLESPQGKTLGFFPQLGVLTPALVQLFSTLDLLLMDGTFWSEDELIRLQGSTQHARDMGHLPVGGDHGSLEQLTGLNKPRKMYIHINNTNPMLNQAGAEYRAVRKAGWELAEDRSHFTL